MNKAIEIASKTELDDLITHANGLRDWQIPSFVHFSIDHAMHLIIILQQLTLQSIGKRKRNPLLTWQHSNEQWLLLREDLDLEFPLRRHKHHELIILNH